MSIHQTLKMLPHTSSMQVQSCQVELVEFLESFPWSPNPSQISGGGSSRNFPWSPNPSQISGGSSRNFPWSPNPSKISDPLQISGGGGSSRNFPWGGGGWWQSFSRAQTLNSFPRAQNIARVHSDPHFVRSYRKKVFFAENKYFPQVTRIP